MTVTIFRHAKEKEHPYYRDVMVILDRIKNCTIQAKIDAIRNESDPKKKRLLKEGLPSICFSGKFTTRNDDSITQHSGLCTLDFDHIADPVAKKSELSKYPYVFAAFISPSGDGVKALVRIPPDKNTHRNHYKALLAIFGGTDTTSINLSRVCFESCDKDIYINPDATVFTDVVEVKEEVVTAPVDFRANNYAKADRAVKMVRNAADGQKHIELLKAAKLMGGFIAGGDMDESEGIRLLEQEISHRKIDDFEGAKKTIRAGIEYGKARPIVEIELEIKRGRSNGVKNHDSLWDKMKHGFYHGKERGTTTRFSRFDENWTWKKGELTLIMGMPNRGKTEFMLQLMLIKSVFDGDKWAVFSPENYPEDEFFDTLIHAYIGKSTDPHYANNQMSIDEYKRGYDFITSHFFYVYPDEAHTMEEIESNFIWLIEEKGVTGAFIDPFNQIDQPSFKRDDQILSLFLSQRKRFASHNEIYYIVSSHPKAMVKNNDGEYDVPDIYDIAGGAMWGNKMDNIIAIHRPAYSKDPMDTRVEIHVKKIKKQRLVGVPGMSDFTFSRASNRYYQDMKSPLDKQSDKPRQSQYPEITQDPDAPF